MDSHNGVITSGDVVGYYAQSFWLMTQPAQEKRGTRNQCLFVPCFPPKGRRGTRVRSPSGQTYLLIFQNNEWVLSPDSIISSDLFPVTSVPFFEIL